MKAIQVLIRIINTNEILENSNLNLQGAIEYCNFVNELINSLQLEDLLEVETTGCENDKRLLHKDEVQNQTAIVHQLVCGAARNSENLRGYFINLLIQFMYKNQSSVRNRNVSMVKIVEQNLSVILDSWTKAGAPIQS